MVPSDDWKILPFPEGYLHKNGPFHARVTNGGHLAIGLRVTAEHCNAAGNCHGGMLSSFADLQLTFGSRFALGIDIFLPTISLSTDFIGGAPQDSWMEGETRLLKATRNLVFSECLIHADGELVLRANGLLRNAREGAPLHAVRLQEMFR